jgi:hypothetical protein
MFYANFCFMTAVMLGIEKIDLQPLKLNSPPAKSAAKFSLQT